MIKTHDLKVQWLRTAIQHPCNAEYTENHCHVLAHYFCATVIAINNHTESLSHCFEHTAKTSAVPSLCSCNLPEWIGSVLLHGANDTERVPLPVSTLQEREGKKENSEDA